MATIKVFDCKGTRELTCFATLDNVPYIEIEDEEVDEQSEPEEKNPFE